MPTVSPGTAVIPKPSTFAHLCCCCMSIHQHVNRISCFSNTTFGQSLLGPLFFYLFGAHPVLGEYNFSCRYHWGIYFQTNISKRLLLPLQIIILDWDTAIDTHWKVNWGWTLDFLGIIFIWYHFRGFLWWSCILSTSPVYIQLWILPSKLYPPSHSVMRGNSSIGEVGKSISNSFCSRLHHQSAKCAGRAQVELHFVPQTQI